MTPEQFCANAGITPRELRRLHVRGRISEPYTNADVDEVRGKLRKLGEPKPCAVCGSVDDSDWHRCCSVCGVRADGEDEVESVFGFYAKKNGPRRAQSACRDCRRKARKKPKRVRPEHVPEPVAEAAHTTMSTPVVKMNRRKPYECTVRMKRDNTDFIRFGPIELDVITHNTPEGASMVPPIDPNYVFDTTEKIVLANALKNDERTFIHGPSGAGKTSGVSQMCALVNWPLYRLPMSGDMGVAEIVGNTEVVIDNDGNAVTAFVDGLLLRSMLNGGVLLIDEITATPPHILLELQQVLERSIDPAADWRRGVPHCRFYCKQTSEIVEAHPRFRIIATDNTAGTGDVTGAYAGTNALNEAFRSRFTQWYRKEYPDPETWADIIEANTGCAPRDAAEIVKIAIDCNRVSSLLPGTINSDVSFAINPRDTLSIGRQTLVYGDIGIAFLVAYVDRLEGTDREFLLDVLRNHGALT